jgi:geranylgeranyl reductase family protein
MTDVAVVGAGPAGAWTAYCLARSGARVCIIDGSHPREKACGGGVTGRALDLVKPAWVAGQPPSVQVKSARFVDTAARRSAIVPLDDSPVAPALVVASRAAFDAALLNAAQHAGVEHVSARATAVLRHNGGFRIATTRRGVIDAPFLVGADGSNSFVRRTLAAAFRRDQLSIATGFFAHGVTSDEIVLELVADPPGYLWSFPRPDHLAIGICAQADSGVTSGALRERVRRWIDAAGLAPAAALEPYAWPIPSLSAADFRTMTPSGPGWMLVGDAAGLVDPITREGIFFALQSAELAARAIAAPGRHLPHATYTMQLRREVGSELARAASFKAGFFRPRFSRLLIEAVATSAPIRHVVADLVAGTQPYRGLKWRLARTGEVKLALRALWRQRPSDVASGFSRTQM